MKQCKFWNFTFRKNCQVFQTGRIISFFFDCSHCSKLKGKVFKQTLNRTPFSPTDNYRPIIADVSQILRYDNIIKWLNTGDTFDNVIIFCIYSLSIGSGQGSGVIEDDLHCHCLWKPIDLTRSILMTAVPITKKYANAYPMQTITDRIWLSRHAFVWL